MTGWAYDKVYEPPRDFKSLEEIVAKLRSENKELIEVVAEAIWKVENEPWEARANERHRIMAKAAIVAMNLFVVNQEKETK